jgi:hypothetical protein
MMPFEFINSLKNVFKKTKEKENETSYKENLDETSYEENEIDEFQRLNHIKEMSSEEKDTHLIAYDEALQHKEWENERMFNLIKTLIEERISRLLTPKEVIQIRAEISRYDKNIYDNVMSIVEK